MDPTPRIDVVIPTYNARQLVLDCVDALGRAEGVARIVVVDDVSADGTVEAVASRHPEVTAIRLERHGSLAGALNRGAGVGEAEYVLFLNNDVICEPTAPARLAAALAEDPAAVAAGGRLVDPGTTDLQPRYQPCQLPGLGGLIVRLIGLERLWPANPWTGRHLTAPLDQGNRQRTERQLAGACLMVRRTALEEAGGWDERYPMWYEDVDLARRLGGLGPALYVPDAIFEHLGGASSRHWQKAELHRRLYRSTLIYGHTHLPRRQQRLLAALMVSVCLPRVAGYWLIDREAAATYRGLVREALAMLAQGGR